MSNSSADVSRTIGFCTVRAHAEHGFFGGYLILNTHARPLEFHCTLPVKPSRAQEILYGRTLPDFVCGEQIGKALTSKAKLTPQLVLTDCSAVLALSHVSDVLVACITDAVAATNNNIPAMDAERLRSIKIGTHQATILRDDLHTAEKLSDLWRALDVTMDICEPFQRIAEALLEAHPIMKAA